ncbi:uncharacterized protein A1O5_10091 [Cladophialophora psammophila CBS 110553]|uniref:Uncharacterized protein n=1 Tax=Cladophialophora psammophila CBS 110553 TaxID=1182543 RepID=W9WQI0_9EURO|nr:uncharacterized protein A1O5_10091 [Cladophialophora psammophila CBS 110553]EXJ66896.1 hypothetical protein A1O5_10091 [Cladophialophora psammophila CBS 110553]
MFTWYTHAKTYYVYLADVYRAGLFDPHTVPAEFSDSRWFQRGRTLQELMASKDISVDTRDWTWIGTKSSLIEVLQTIGVSQAALTLERGFLDYSLTQRMSWASK